MRMKEQAIRRGVMYDLAIMVEVVCLLLFLLPTWGRSEQTSLEGCPPLPEQGAVDIVVVHVAKALDVCGVVCARVINGISPWVSSGGFNPRLQKWEAGKWWRKGQFRDFGETKPGDIPMLVTLDLHRLEPGIVANQRLPFSGQPAPPGRYRVCFSYRLRGQKQHREACSEEFTLP